MSIEYADTRDGRNNSFPAEWGKPPPGRARDARCLGT